MTPSWLQGKKRNFISIFLCRAYQSLRAFNFGSICSYFHPDSCFVTSPPSQFSNHRKCCKSRCSVRGSQTITVFHLRVKKKRSSLRALYFCTVLLVAAVLSHFSFVWDSLKTSLHKSIAGNKIQLKNFKIVLEKSKNGVK